MYLCEHPCPGYDPIPWPVERRQRHKMHTAPLRLACGFEKRRILENKHHDAPRLGTSDDYDRLLEAQRLRRPAISYDQTVDRWFEQLGTTVWPLDEALLDWWVRTPCRPKV